MNEVDFTKNDKFPIVRINANKLNMEIKNTLNSKILSLPEEDKSLYRDSITFTHTFKQPDEVAKWIDEWQKREFDNINDGNTRRTIELPGTGLLISNFSDELVEYLKYKDKIFFRKDINEVVEIREDGFSIIKANRFITVVEKYFNPYVKIKQNGGSVEYKEKSMTPQISSIVLASPNLQDNIKNIKRIFPVAIPIIHNEKLTLPKKGYDKRFSSWLNKDSLEIKKDIPLGEAKKKIEEIFKEFCFQEEQDKTNAIAALITPFLRGIFSSFNVRTPLFCYMANRERAGKDYAAGITGLILEGKKVEESPISSGEFRASGGNDELRKKLLASMIAGKKRYHSANNKGKLNNAVLEFFLTNNIFTERLLGKNESLSIDNEMDVSLSGNIGMTFTPDLANRSRFIRLFLEIEDANKRNFENPDLHETILKERGYILSCIYALIRNWFEKNRPKGTVAFSSFPEWAKVCGGIMECAGYSSPCTADESIQSIGIDNETEEMKKLYEICFEKNKDQWMKRNEIIDLVRTEDSDMFTYLDFTKTQDMTKFGMRLNKFKGRYFSEIIMIEKNPKLKGSRKEFKFIRKDVTPVNPVTPIPLANKRRNVFNNDKGKQGDKGNRGNKIEDNSKEIQIK